MLTLGSLLESAALVVALRAQIPRINSPHFVASHTPMQPWFSVVLLVELCLTHLLLWGIQLVTHTLHNRLINQGLLLNVVFCNISHLVVLVHYRLLDVGKGHLQVLVG